MRSCASFSPHTRGCSAPVWVCCRSSHRFPRIRGDVPQGVGTASQTTKFSPHTRGCSANPNPYPAACTVFPAYAGMFPRGSVQQVKPLSFPRIRGDVPQIQIRTRRRVQFSPHTRGCSARAPTCDWCIGVFPAYAGMFLNLKTQLRAVMGFPRIRGDVPVPPWRGWMPARFSPHTRGCSLRNLTR